METIKVLALDDDKYCNCYITRTNYYQNCAQFVKECLLAPHNYQFEIRQIELIDPPEAFVNMDKGEFIRQFKLLAYEYCPDELFYKDPHRWSERKRVFELFWANGKEWRGA